MTDIVARALALQAQESNGANQYNSSLEFPTVGADGALYIDITNNKVYYWNADTLSYVVLISGEQDVPTEIKKTLDDSVIDGGDAKNDE